MQNEVFSWVVQDLSGALPEDWEQVSLYICFCDHQPSMNIFVKTGDAYQEVLTLGIMPEEELVRVLMKLMGIFRYDRGLIPEGQEWTSFAFSCGRDEISGYKFGYDTISDDVGFEMQWRGQWLK